MDYHRFRDPVLELMRRTAGGPDAVLEFAELSDEDADLMLQALDEAEAEVTAGDLAGRLRQMGHIL